MCVGVWVFGGLSLWWRILGFVLWGCYKGGEFKDGNCEEEEEEEGEEMVVFDKRVWVLLVVKLII